MAVTYSMDKPHTYYELLAFPKDLRKEYLEGVIKKYHPSIPELVKMLRCRRETLMQLLNSLEIEKPRTYRNPAEKFEWRVFMGENITPPEPIPEIPVVAAAAQPSVLGIGKIDHMSIHVVGKPLSVAQGIPALLDPNKNYYFNINITEVEEKKEENESIDCFPGEAS